MGREILEEITSTKFLKASQLFIEKPHIINKKICGIDNLWIGGSNKTEFSVTSLALEVDRIINASDSDNVCWEMFLPQILLNNGFFTLKNEEKKFLDLSQNFRYFGFVRKVLPRNPDVKEVLWEIVLCDISNSKFVFIPKISFFTSKIIPGFPYLIFLNEDKIIRIKPLKEIAFHDPGLKWLNGVLLPSVEKWSRHPEENPTGRNTVSSLSLVDIQKYNAVYQNLKRKYAQNLKELWCEVTDPQKFIHEDIAIAAYLIVLWEKERESKNLIAKQSFIDLGCGNGLLVYILSSEGHPGMGIDIKRRKLWDKFPKTVCLKEDVIIPSDKCLYPQFDWLIGNHSDELTPWLPVISAKSSVTSRYFVIPCCAHDFNCKFQRIKSGVSLYSEYLEYVKEIGQICGFEVWQDKLRIPSTKRTCFVAQNLNYSLEKRDEIIDRLNEFVRSRCQIEKKLTDNDIWCQDFKPREAIQKTRNCTQMDKRIRDKIVGVITNLLLSQPNFIQVKKNEEEVNWNKGGKCTFKDIIENLSADDLQHMKRECGGLQTLIRNHKFIFQIEKGYIGIRVPQFQRTVKSNLVKTKFCWFDSFHPQGCILRNEDCTYIHS